MRNANHSLLLLRRVGGMATALVVCCLTATSSFAARRRASAERLAGSVPVPIADSLTGRWESRSRNPAYGGDLYLRMTLEQKGDSLAGTIVLEYHDNASEAPTDLAGSVRDGRFKLTSRFGVIELIGMLRNGKLETRVIPGRAAEASAFNATFTRMK